MTAAIRVSVIDGPTVTLRYDEITGRDVADFNIALARPAAFAGVVNDPGTHDLDVAAALLWIGWRRNQPRLSFHQVASTLTFDAPCAIELVPNILEDEVDNA